MAKFTRAMRPEYKITWFQADLCAALDDVVSGACRRLIVTMPPGHGKSEYCSRLLPAYFVGRNPTGKIILTSYGADLARDASRDARAIVQSDRYRWLFPETEVSADSSAIERWGTTGGGSVVAQGVGGAITGRRADLIVVDDPLKDREEAESKAALDSCWNYFTGTLMTRLLPGGRIVVIMTRWSPKDLVGRLLGGPRAAEWRVLHFPAVAEDGEMWRNKGDALWPERYPSEELARMREMSPYDFESLYQGRPYNRGGQYLKREWFEVISARDVPPGLRWVRGVDLAVSIKKRADQTASVRMARHLDGGIETFYIAGGWARREEWPTTRRIITERAKAERIKLVVEAVAGFDVAFRELAAELGSCCQVVKVSPTRDKLARALPWIAAAESRRVALVSGDGSAGWVDEFLAQAEAFPSSGVHDDLIDAASLAYEGLKASGMSMLWDPRYAVAVS
ncbi:MAG: terminase family protein [Bryobacteraceae bacterium]